MEMNFAFGVDITLLRKSFVKVMSEVGVVVGPLYSILR